MTTAVAMVAAPVVIATARCLLNSPVEPMPPIDPTEPIDAIDPVEPIDRIEPAEPIESAEPVDPIDKTEPNDAIDSIEVLDQIDLQDPTDQIDRSDVMVSRASERRRIVTRLPVPWIGRHSRTFRLPNSSRGGAWLRNQ